MDNKMKNSVISVKKICPKCPDNCSICNSPLVEEIHNLFDSNSTYENIVSYCSSKNISHSTASLSRHFQKYKEYKNQLIAEKMNENLLANVDAVARHKQYAIDLADKIYNMLAAGGVEPSVDDFVKLTKLAHRELDINNKEDDSSIIEIFRRAKSELNSVSLFAGVVGSSSDNAVVTGSNYSE